MEDTPPLSLIIIIIYPPLLGPLGGAYYDDVMQRAVSKFVPAEDLVVPYYAQIKDL